jgi:hypothetical protein
MPAMTPDGGGSQNNIPNMKVQTCKIRPVALFPIVLSAAAYLSLYFPQKIPNRIFL